MTAWMIRAATEVLGATTELTVRLPAILCMAAAAMLCYSTARRCVLARSGAEPTAARAGFIACALILFTPILAVLSVYMSTDPPFLLWWSLAMYFALEALTANRIRTWFGLGVALGLASLAKFLSLHFAVAFGLVLVVRSRQGNGVPWGRLAVAVATAAVVALPLFLWNAAHDWATFRFNLFARHLDQPISPLRPLGYVAGQAVVLTPGLFVCAVVAATRATRSGLRDRCVSGLLLGACAAVPVLFFLFSSLRTRVGMHWAAAGWIAALIWFAVGIAESRVRSRAVRWSIGSAVAISIAAHVLALLLPLVAPDLAALRWSVWDSKRPLQIKAVNEIFGWRELGARVDQTVRSMAEQDAPEAFVISNQYGVASSIAFYRPGDAPTHLWAPHRRHGENYRYWDDWPALRGRDALFVAKKNVEIELPVLARHFETVEAPTELPIEVSGRVVRSFYLVRCRGFDGRDPYP